MKRLSIESIKHLYADKSVEPQKILNGYFEAAKKNELNSFISFANLKINEFVLQPEKTLSGVPIAVQDNIATVDMPTSCASSFFNQYESQFEASCVKKLKDAGAVVIGKANLDELGYSCHGLNGFNGSVINPINANCVTGGAASGACSAVAGGQVPIALSSSTALFEPAAYCGNVAFSPSYGMLSRYGLISSAPSMDRIAIASNNIADASLIFSLIRGSDPCDSISNNFDESKFKKINCLKDIKVAYFQEHLSDLDNEISEHFLKLLEKLKPQVSALEQISLEAINLSSLVYEVLSAVETYSTLNSFNGFTFGPESSASTWEAQLSERRGKNIGIGASLGILAGAIFSSKDNMLSYQDKAARVRGLLMEKIKALFGQYDLIICPTVSTQAPTLNDAEKIDVNQHNLMLTSILLGLPAIALPLGALSSKIQFSFGLWADHLNDELLFKAASLMV